MLVHVKRTDKRAQMPVYAHASDAGMDIFTLERVEIPAGERVMVPTGLSFAIPEGYVGLIWDKSGVAAKRGVTMLAGVLDSGYRGEVTLVALNTSKETQTFGEGEKITQILIQPITQPELVEVEELDDTQRGEGAFGSTGVI